MEAENVPDEIPLATSTALHRITQEALRNTAEHANSHTQIFGSAKALQLSIEDDGPDFRPLNVRFRGGVGLISMHERASSVGGLLHLTSAPGQGTRIEANVPLPGSQQ